MAYQSEYNPVYCPPVEYANEFPPLSIKEVEYGQSMPQTHNPVDDCEMQKQSPEPNSDDEEEDLRADKDFALLIPDSDSLITHGNYQIKQTNAITAELISLLEHEKKLLTQLITRADKFKMLAEENMNEKEEWEAENNKKLPEYTLYQDRLINIPESTYINVEGVPGQIQQKILFQIATKTISAINTVLVQLSMEDTIANDIHLSLRSIKNKCSYMLKKVNGWLKYLRSQDCNQKLILDRWELVDKVMDDVKEKAGLKVDEDGPGPDGDKIGESNNSVSEDYLKETIRRMEQYFCQHVCPHDPACKNVRGQNVQWSDTQSDQYSSPNTTQARPPAEGDSAYIWISMLPMDMTENKIRQFIGDSCGPIKNVSFIPYYEQDGQEYLKVKILFHKGYDQIRSCFNKFINGKSLDGEYIIKSSDKEPF